MASALLLVVILTAACLSDGDGDGEVPKTVSVDGVTFEVEVVMAPADRVRGLSGRDHLPPMKGMLFVPESRSMEVIWMKEMRFPLDLIWIGGNCTVVDTTLNAAVPAPDTPDADLPFYVPAAAAAYVLEVNAGEVRSMGVETGDEVSFSEGLGC